MRTAAAIICAIGSAAAFYFAGGHILNAITDFSVETRLAKQTTENQSQKSTEVDPVAQFKELLTRHDKWKAVSDELILSYEFLSNTVAIDVRKTDSLVFPLAGTARFVVMQEAYNSNGTLFSRRKPIFMEVTFNYSYEKKQWSAAGWRMAHDLKDAERGKYKSIGDTRSDISEGAPAQIWANQILKHLFP